MKKNAFAIVLAVLMLFSAGAMAMTAGTYEGEANGIGGPVKVAVTVSETAIESVEIVSHSETAGISDPAIEKIPAAIVEGQTLAVDAVAGASVTSGAILTAVEQALTEAGADIEALKVKAETEAVPGETVELTADVVVIGAGGAGVAAAVEACDAGAKVVLLEKMAKGELLGGEDDARMLSILYNQRLNGKIPFFLHGVKIAHKTGEDDGTTHDVALIQAKRPFVLCMLSNDVDVPEYERLMQDTARELYEMYNR